MILAYFALFFWAGGVGLYVENKRVHESLFWDTCSHKSQELSKQKAVREPSSDHVVSKVAFA